MNGRIRRVAVSLTLATLTMGIAASAWAGTQSTSDLKPMLINAPVLISAGAGWQGHWAQKDLEALRASASPQPAVLISGANDPNDAMTMRSLADVLTYLYGAGGEQGDALDRAVKLGLIRPTDFVDGQIHAEQTVSRELFALLLTRALGLNGAEDATSTPVTLNFVDGSAIQAKYRAAVGMMQAEGLLIGDGEGRFSPSQPVTFAQATRTVVKVSAWAQQKVAKLAGLNPASATYLFGGKPVTLEGGIAQKPAAPGSASMEVTRLTDRQAVGDLNGDRKLDVAVTLVRTTGGSGTFYYLGVVLNGGSPVETAFLGDRIVVQNVRIVDGKVAVDMLTRGASEPMVAQPTIKETRTYEVKDGALVPSAR